MANFEVLVYGITIETNRLVPLMHPLGLLLCGIIEDLIQFGMEKSFFWDLWVLDRDIEATSIIIPTAALRDEGTSYHYLPASDEVEVNKKTLPLPSLSGQSQGFLSVGKVWTTDELIEKPSTR
ncbi:MAG: hypothetical protein ACLRRK_03635 [Parasutterella sp.]